MEKDKVSIVKKGLSHRKYKAYLREKLSKSYNFFDLEFIKFSYLMPCNDYNKVLKMSNKRFDDILNDIFNGKIIDGARKEKYLKYLKLFFANLVAKDGEMIISLSMIDYAKDGIYYGIIPLVVLRNILNVLEKREYIEIKKGEFHYKNTTIYPTRKLWEEFGELENLKLQIRKMSHVTGYAEERGEKFEKIVSTVENQENELAKHTVTIKYKNERLKNKYSAKINENISLGETMFRRSFLGSGKGGRFYARGKGGIYQRMPGELRECLNIDGEETIEMDFKCEHLNLLYAKQNIDMWKMMKDAYSIDGINCEYRFIVKTALLVMLNCKKSNNLFSIIYAHFNKDKEQWRRKIFFEKFMKEYSDEQKFNEFIEKIKNKHSYIENYFCSGIGAILQRYDSDIMAEILDKCLEEGIVALPVHDSVIVKKKHLEKVKNIMENAFNNHTGFEAQVTYEKGK